MKKVNTFFLILVISALVVTFILTLIPKKTFALFDEKNLSCMGPALFSSPFPTIFLLGAGTLLGIGLLSALIQIIKTQLFLNNLLSKKMPPSSDLKKIFQNVGINNKVVVIKDKNLFSFCAGFVFPFIVISTSLIKSLTKKELEAVLLHEQSHLLNRDPLKVFIGKTLSSMFFFLPIFKELHKNAESSAEFLADQWTIKYQKKSGYLRKALKKVLSKPSENLGLVSNASNPDYFEIRIHRLVNPNLKLKKRFSFFSVATTSIFIIVSFVMLNAPAKADHMQKQDLQTACIENQSCQKQCHPSKQKELNYIPVDKCSNFLLH
ncbi:M48 family metalloprotease [Candidatus Daviesbacteria bacterium]|nr:M48 family metalloprotease [Candidatus Daviesbacteria bacterium]